MFWVIYMLLRISIHMREIYSTQCSAISLGNIMLHGSTKQPNRTAGEQLAEKLEVPMLVAKEKLWQLKDLSDFETELVELI